jgi:hypothetical protein
MDARNFDALTKHLTNPRSRRGLLGSVLGFLTVVIGVQEGKAKRKRPKTESRKGTIRTKRQVTASVKKCRPAGAPCEGNQADLCCARLACTESDRGSARRCTPCAAEGASCAGDEACCGGACCLGLNPVGVCCASRDRCCGGDCCVGERRVCDFRFTMCVTCRTAGEFCNELIVCCPGLRCDVSGGACISV